METSQVKKIEKQPTSVISVLNSEAFQNRMRQILPDFLKPERIAGIAITELRNNQKLLNCDALSLVGAIIRAGQLGLDIDSMKGHAYLVPYKNECQLIVGYKGMLTLANRSGKLKSIEVQEVRENDFFEMEHGDNHGLRHKISPRRSERGQIIGYYAYAHLSNGGKMFEYMDQEEINEIKACSKSSNSYSSPWTTFPVEMSKKTVVRRLCKYLALSPDMDGAIGLDEMVDAGVQSENLKKIGKTYAEELERNNSNVEFDFEKVTPIEDKQENVA